MAPSPTAGQLPQSPAIAFGPTEITDLLAEIRQPLHLVLDQNTARIGLLPANAPAPSGPGLQHLATLPPLYPEWLGDRGFNEAHGVRFPYVSGAMANGIATVEMVVAMAEAGMLGFFGAGGLAFPRVQEAAEQLQRALGPSGLPFGMNLIHSPNEPELEASVADLYLRTGVQRVSAAAYMALTPSIVRYAATGLGVDNAGRITRRNHVFAKVSRPEVAKHFLSPAPTAILQPLVDSGLLTAEEARLAARIPLAEDITVEADSGGHTDNQTLTAVFPVICALRDELSLQYGYERPIRVGAAGGLGTPGALAAAFSMGAAYVLTGSVNQSAVESGLSPAGRQMLAQASMADVAMAPAADMFEQGVELQVLKRGTMFPSRAHRLLAAYRAYPGLDAIDAAERGRIEKQVLGCTFAEVRKSTRDFWQERDPAQNKAADADPKHEMALCFRWYLGLSSRWAIVGEPTRRLDYQIWCGPAMGAFNDWVRGSFLEPAESRQVVQIARNLLEGAAITTRAHQLRTYGVAVPPAAFRFIPRPLA